jgi:hypothetical protein
MSGDVSAAPALSGSPAASPPLAWSRREAVISGVILFHLLALVIWCFDMQAVPRTRIGMGLARYMVFSGLYQGWDMFAPDPLSVNSYLEADITYWDGRMQVWRFPRPQDVGYFDRMFTERYRKWANERLRDDDNAALWPDAARYIARLNNNPKNPPATVSLVRYWSEIAPPGSGRPEPWHRYVFFRYTVAPADLR